MKLSVFYNHIVKASEQSGLPLTDVLDKVHAYGIEAVELDLEEALTGTEAMIKRLDAAGLSVASMYAFLTSVISLHRSRGTHLSIRQPTSELARCWSSRASPGIRPARSSGVRLFRAWLQR